MLVIDDDPLVLEGMNGIFRQWGCQVITADTDDKALKAASARASLRANVEVYPGTTHGWCVPGSNRYNRDAAEKAWGELVRLFKGELR